MIQLAAVLLLPMVFGINGIWCAVAVAEAVTLVITITFLVKNKKNTDIKQNKPEYVIFNYHALRHFYIALFTMFLSSG